MATINEQGITLVGLEGFREQMRDVMRSVFGNDLSFDPETPQEEFSGLIATALTEQENSLAAAYQALNIYRSFGTQLSGHGAVIGLERREAQSSTVTVTLTGVPSTVIPAGTRAKTNNDDLFSLRDSTQLDGSGTASAIMESVTAGPIPIPAASLTNIVDVVVGWETVTNPNAGSVGSAIENDPDYLRRYFRELFRNATSPFAAIRSRISAVANVTRVGGAENDLPTAQTINGISIPRNATAMVVEGGEDADIAAAIYASKTGGGPTFGDTTVSVLDDAGFNRDINFFRLQNKPIEIELSITVGDGFAGNGVNLIKERIISYINGTFDGGANQFETDGMLIGEDIRKFRLYTPINSVAGHDVTSLVLKRKNVSEDVETIPANLNERIVVESLDDITITVS